MSENDRSQGASACHVFDLDSASYAYDLNTQQIIAVEPELAELLRGDGPGTPAASEALWRARAEGLFSSHRPHLVPRPPESQEAVERDLRHLVLTVTESCNLRCAYCLHGAGLDAVRPHGERRMSVATALKAAAYYLDRSDPNRAPAVSFYGGEPLHNREVIEAVSRLVRASPRGDVALLSIDTNGVLLDDAAIDFVIRNRIRLQISLDGPAAIHDRYRRDAVGAPTHERILVNVGKLLDRDPQTAARMSFAATLAPPVDLFAVADFFAAFPPFVARGIRRQPNVTVNFADPRGQGWPRDAEATAGLPPISGQIAAARKRYFDAIARGRRDEPGPVIRALFEPALIRWFHRSRAPLGETYSPGGNCRPGRRKLHVTADGRLQPCERVGDGLEIGDLDGGIAAKEINRLRARFHHAAAPRCASCWALRLCGACFAALAETDSRTDAWPDGVCERIRARQEENLKLAVRILALPRAKRKWLDDMVLD